MTNNIDAETQARRARLRRRHERFEFWHFFVTLGCLFAVGSFIFVIGASILVDARAKTIIVGLAALILSSVIGGYLLHELIQQLTFLYRRKKIRD